MGFVRDDGLGMASAGHGVHGRCGMGAKGAGASEKADEGDHFFHV
jgi:hypothetical protein